MRSFSTLAALLTAAALAAVPLAPADAQPQAAKAAEPKQDAKLAELIAPVRDKHRVPAAFAAVVRADELLAVAAVGVRKAGSDEPVTVNDKVHIGSNTKAMTATLVAMLIEEKKFRWGSTVGEVLPDLKGKVHNDYLGVTLAQLLSHTGGVVPNTVWWAAPKDKSPREQRAALLPAILKKEPADKPGAKFAYSNASYVVAAAMAEAAAEESWEEMLAERLFKPLGMASAGFGPPGEKGKIGQPWGHTFGKEKLKPSQSDNAPVMGPAGTVHVSLRDWAKFAFLHLRGARGEAKLLKPESFAALHTPAEGFTYAGGWVVGEDGNLAHDGSNTFWYARIRLHPKGNFAVLCAVNAGGDEALAAVEDMEKVATGYYRDRFKKE